MLVARTALRCLAIIAVLFLIGACDDDDENKIDRYEVRIYISDHIDVNSDSIIRVKPEGRFKKPRVEVDTPEGVVVEQWKRPKRKGKIYSFAPIAFPALMILVLAAALRSGCVHPPRLKLQV